MILAAVTMLCPPSAPPEAAMAFEARLAKTSATIAGMIGQTTNDSSDATSAITASWEFCCWYG